MMNLLQRNVHSEIFPRRVRSVQVASGLYRERPHDRRRRYSPCPAGWPGTGWRYIREVVEWSRV
jgi:hypothetical protein